jgi:hypothetical protein
MLALVLVSWAIPALTVRAAQDGATMERGRLSFATSPRLHRNSWAHLGCLLRNPETQPRTVAVRLLMDSSGSMSQRTVMTRHVQIPAGAEMYYRTLALIEDMDQYKMEMFIDDRRMPGVETMTFRLLSDREEQMAVVNDGDELGFGSFASYPDLKERWRTAFFRAVDLPDSWAFFQHTHSVILLGPDFSRCSERQLGALRDYVAGGGRLVVVHPQAVLAMASSPLADMLPVAPLRMRQIADLPSLARYAPGFKGWVEETQPFLECEPVGEGVTLLAEAGLPVFRWRRYGLGEVRVSMIPLTEDGLRQAGGFSTPIKVFLRGPPLLADRSRAERCLDEMTGFSVPGPWVIRRIFIVYFLLLAAILVLGFKVRRSTTAWLAGAVLGLLITGLILKRAAGGSGEDAGRLLAALEVNVAGGPTEGFYGLFSTADTTVDVPAADEQVLFSAIPPGGAAFRLGLGMGGGGTSEPVEVAVHDGRFAIHGLTVRSNTSRPFTALATSDEDAPPSFLAGGPLPDVMLGGRQPAFAPWTLPEGRRPEAAWLLFPSGAFPLAVEKDKLIMASGADGGFQANEIIRAVQDYLQGGCRIPDPCLVWMEPAEDVLFPTPEATTPRIRRLTLLPVRETWGSPTAGEFQVGPEQIVLSAADSSTRMLMAGNEIRHDTASPRMIQDMTLRFHLPPLCAEIKATRIELDLDFSNPSGSLLVTPVLLPDPGIGSPIPPATREIAARPQGNGRYVFTDLADALDPKEGTGLLRLKFSSRDEGMNEVQRMRGNHWQINGLRLRIAGALPEAIAGARF